MEFGGLTALVVEDHEFQRQLAIRCLRDLGIEGAMEAENGRDALNRLLVLDRPVDLILCDLDMPEMDGVEFISHVALNHLAKAVIVVSGLDPAILHTVETMARAYRMQVLGAIHKPLTHEQLSACLSRFNLPGIPNGSGPSASETSLEDLQRSLQSGEFIPLFQPKVSLSTGDLVGVEVLVRWFRPAHGVLLPQDFLPAIEREGLMADLLETMLIQTCGHLKAWNERGLALSAALNVSTLSLSELPLADRLEDLVRAQGCETRQIIFEIIETGLGSDLAPVLKVLARLRLKGFGLSMDCFGSGFTEPHRLSNMPFSGLKIDQASMREAQKQEWNRTLVEMSLEMARRLNLRTVAERIETRADWDMAKTLGWDEAQGFFISRPIPGHQIPEWAKSWRVRMESMRGPAGA